MKNINLQDIEKVSDYSLLLMEEVMADIKNLSRKSSTDAGAGLNNINKKIDLARGNGVNVDALDKQVLDFRVVLFKRDVDNMLERIREHTDKYNYETSKIESEYEELKKEKNIDLVLLTAKMKEVQDEIVKAKIRFMIRNIGEGENHSAFTFDRIAHEISEAKESGINVDEIEEMLFG